MSRTSHLPAEYNVSHIPSSCRMLVSHITSSCRIQCLAHPILSSRFPITQTDADDALARKTARGTVAAVPPTRSTVVPRALHLRPRAGGPVAKNVPWPWIVSAVTMHLPTAPANGTTTCGSGLPRSRGTGGKTRNDSESNVAENCRSARRQGRAGPWADGARLFVREVRGREVGEGNVVRKNRWDSLRDRGNRTRCGNGCRFQLFQLVGQLFLVPTR